MTVSDEGEDQFRYVDGPTGFGNAMEFPSDSRQCLVHKRFTIESDTCTTNLDNCEDGLSLSVWYKGYQGIERDWEFVSQDPNDPSIIETIASTGGDTKGHPGIALYLQGMTVKAVVSTGAKYWNTSCVGMIKNDKWTNIAFSWKHDKGLLLYIDTKLEASTMFPASSPGAKPALTPPQMHLGCHSDATNTEYRYFLEGAVDELAVWDKALLGTDAGLFLGDHIRSFADVTVEDLNSIVDDSDISDPDVMAAALLITAQSTYSEEVPEGALTVPTTAATTTTTTTTTTTANSDVSTTDSGSGATTTTTMQPESDAYKHFKSVMKLFKKFTSTTLKNVDIMKLQNTLGLVDVTSNIFVQKNKEFLMGAEVGEEKDGEARMTVNANQIIEDLTNWTMRILQNTDYRNRTEMFTLVKETENLIVHVFKGPHSALHTRSNGFVVAPDCEMMVKKKSWNSTCNRAAVSSAVVTDPKCKNRTINVVITSSRNVHRYSHTWAVGGDMDPYLPHELNTMVMSVLMSPDPVLDKKGNVDKKAPKCKPNPKALLQSPIRLKLFNLRPETTHSHQSRKLSFHEEAPVKRVLGQHCAWWDANNSRWDGTGCLVMENTDRYTKCACAHFGSFTVMNELIEPRVVPDEHLWLLVLRYVGYALSILLIIIYIIVVAVSRDLKDQFHLMGLNLAVAVLVGAVAMVVSDLEAVRDDRHWCTAVGTIIQLFYQAAGAWVLFLGHATFKAITSGVIGGRLKSYLPISWGLPFISVGLNYLLFMLDLGEDPRCFISWENPPKFVFFGFQLLFVLVSCFCACVVLSNMATTALRKDNLIDDYGSFCNGAAFLMLFFSITWIFGFFCYIRFGHTSLNFYPIFQVLNSWTGVVLFLFIGVASRKFRMVVAGQAKLRREMLMGYTFGNTGEAKGNAAASGPSTSNTSNKGAQPKNNQDKKGKLPPVKKNAPRRAPPRTFTAD
ncbi:uncharacterized protein LOC135108533 [Scylla paramamosain]|uniref:uncharacterized protein LOC135108533 n=1 Tax=Scylla paramamosain TaxID=85552 RepID=UPI0030830842